MPTNLLAAQLTEDERYDVISIIFDLGLDPDEDCFEKWCRYAIRAVIWGRSRPGIAPTLEEAA